MVEAFDRLKVIRVSHMQFTMSFKDALLHGIDYREFEKIDALPTDIQLTAIAGIWGDYSNIRCLFRDAGGKGYLRNIKGSGGYYLIRELGVNAKEIEAGTVFVVNA